MFFAVTSAALLLNCLALADDKFENNFIEFPETPDEVKGWGFPTYDVWKSIKFRLYTRNGPVDGQFLDKNPNFFATSYQRTKPVKIITHGYLGSGSADHCINIKEAYLKHQDVNVMILDWKDLAAQNYIQSSMATRDVGHSYGQYIDFLVEQIGVKPSDIHLIGHSLGAHVSGFAGNGTKYKVARISGLDPAYPSFGMVQLVGSRLSHNNAEFVDVIHTSRVGLQDPIGHVDFYPNGGQQQPGCDTSDTLNEIICSHGRGWKYFEESINPSSKFLATQCFNAEEAKRHNCSQIPMGEYVPLSAKGKYYLKTNPATPFAIRNDIFGK